MDAFERVSAAGKGGGRGFVRSMEEHGMALRNKAGLGSTGRLDPFTVKDELNIIIMTPGDLGGLGDADQAVLLNLNARTWSGGAQELPDGRLLILLNPNQTPQRAVITVLEEVAHDHLGHQPSTLVPDQPGALGRHYDADAEKEAYWAAAAALLPSAVVAHAVWDLVPPHVLAAQYGVSIELVEFRMKILRLWPWYSERRTAA